MERHGFSSPIATENRATTGELSPMAFLVGVRLPRARTATPTRRVQRLGPAVECAVLSAMAGPSRGRAALPPLHDEGIAFVIGGGEAAASWEPR